MPAQNAEIVEDFTNFLIDDIKSLIKYVPVIQTQTAEDEKIMEEGISELNRLLRNVESAHSFAELSKSINVGTVISEWSGLRKHISDMSANDYQEMVNRIKEQYRG